MIKGMNKVLISGHAETQTGVYDFKVGNWADGIGLMVRDTGAGDEAFNGAGIWPTIEKAKEIASQIAKRGLRDSDGIVVWTDLAS